ncbi:hypothetical protein ACFOWA_20015 [Pedobacter lithocola]|uniref:HTH cro/C1-type domain-containing protein n=1 Tax=Pedobacter lithocola TaxID=1908239 RepID=A0ABV8PFS6_9SPHI
MANKYDLGQAQRFRIFRKKFINNNSATAAKDLSIAQSRISGIESGKFPIGPPLIKLLEQKYQLNKYWLLDNIGVPQKGEQKTRPTPLLISELGDKIDKLTTEVLVLSKNLDRAWQIIERLNKELEHQQKDIEKLKGKF